MDMTQIGHAPLLTITVPIYNEEANIAPLYEKISAAMAALGKPWELVLVDDGSRDGSPALLDALAAADARVTVVHFPRNYGQTAAMMAGMDHARGDIRGAPGQDPALDQLKDAPGALVIAKTVIPNDQENRVGGA